MANVNGNDSTSQNPEKKICEKLKIIKNEEAASDSLYKANGTKKDSKEIARGYKICCLSQAEESYNIYQDLMSCIVIKNYTKVGIIQKNVDEYIQKDDELEKLINESSKLINDLRVKMNEANDAVCIMVNCVKECILPKTKTGSNKKGNGDDNIKIEVKEVSRLLNDITEKTSKLACKGQIAFNSAVNIAGIQTFMNTGGLKSFATKLMDTMKLFNDCIAENIKTTEKDVTTFRDELNIVVQELAVDTCTWYAEGSKAQGLKNTRLFICEGECDEKEFGISCECADANDCNDNGEHKPIKKQTQTADNLD
jgi:hypothetical protein